MTRGDILRRWPESAVRPAKLTLWRWLSQVVKDGKVLQGGRGDRKDPYCYHLPGMVDKWQPKFMEPFTKKLMMMGEPAGALTNPLNPNPRGKEPCPSR